MDPDPEKDLAYEIGLNQIEGKCRDFNAYHIGYLDKLTDDIIIDILDSEEFHRGRLIIINNYLTEESIREIILSLNFHIPCMEFQLIYSNPDFDEIYWFNPKDYNGSYLKMQQFLESKKNAY